MKKISPFTLGLFIFLGIQPFANFLKAQAPYWQWTHTAGSFSTDFASGVATDLKGNSYITGLFNGTANFGNGITLSSQLYPNVFVTKYDSAGNCLWAKQFGGNDGDIYGNEGFAIDLDAQGNCYVTGNFHGPAGATIPFGSSSLTATGQRQTFVVKYDANGNELWAQNPSSNAAPNNYGESIAADPAGNTYITGYLGGGGNTFGSTNPMYGAGAYVVKHDASGTALWATKIGTNGAAEGLSIAADKEGNSYLTGYLQGTEYFATTPASTITSYGMRDIFVAKLDATGALDWIEHFGRNSQTDSTGPGVGTLAYGRGISLDGLGNIFVTGDFDSLLTIGTTTLISNNTHSSFVAKLDSNGTPIWAMESIASGFGGDAYGTAVKAGATGNCYITGYYYPISNGTESLAGFLFSSSGNQVTYAIKIDSTGVGAWAAFTSGQGSSCLSAGISLDGAGNVYIAGNDQGTNLFGSNSITSNGGIDAFIAKICTGACVTGTTVVTGLKAQSQESAFAIYPNPFSSSATIFTSGYGEHETLELKLYDLLGREVKTLPIISDQSNTIYRDRLEKGMYTYKLCDKNNTLRTGKLMVE